MNQISLRSKFRSSSSQNYCVDSILFTSHLFNKMLEHFLPIIFDWDTFEEREKENRSVWTIRFLELFF